MLMLNIFKTVYIYIRIEIKKVLDHCFFMFIFSMKRFESELLVYHKTDIELKVIVCGLLYYINPL